MNESRLRDPRLVSWSRGTGIPPRYSDTMEPLDTETEDRFGLRYYSVPDLLLLFAQVLRELSGRGVIRSTNNPVADYSEWLTARALGLELVPQSVKDHDALASDGTRYQVKGRRQTPTNRSRQLSAIRGFEFDYLVGVLYNFDFTVMRAAQVPVELVRQHSTWTPHVNGWRFHLRDSIWALPGVIDLSAPLRAAAT